MKIALTVTSPRFNADIDPRFGRGAYLLIVDTDTNSWETFENPGVNASGGAGIKTAQFISNRKVRSAISGDFGPHALAALQAADVAMYLYGDCCTAQEAITRFKAGQLQIVGAAAGGDPEHDLRGQTG